MIIYYVLVCFCSKLLKGCHAVGRCVGGGARPSRRGQGRGCRGSEVRRGATVLVVKGLGRYVRGSQLCLGPSLGLRSITGIIGYGAKRLSRILGVFVGVNFASCIGGCEVSRFVGEVRSGSTSECALISLSRRYNFDSHASFFHSFGGFGKVSPTRCVGRRKVFVR